MSSTPCAGGCGRNVVPVTADDAGQQRGPWYCEECYEAEAARRSPASQLELALSRIGELEKVLERIERKADDGKANMGDRISFMRSAARAALAHLHTEQSDE